MSLLSSRRGVSEIMASLVMLLVVSLLGTVLYAYNQTSLGSVQSSFQYRLSLEEERAKERFHILAVWWNGSSLFNITILNYGKVDMVLDAVYINNNPVKILSGRGEPVYTLKLMQVKFLSPITIVENQIFKIIIVSGQGVTHEYLWTP